MDSAIVGEKIHGTKVAGVIGGNGAGSPNSMFRGIAPKVKFFSDTYTYNKQYGHVLNHSHENHEAEEMDVRYFYIQKGKIGIWDSLADRRSFYYGKNNRRVDELIFKNWNLFTEDGDFLIKTVVQSAGNNGDVAEKGSVVGFHSVLSHFKNTITVGSINALTDKVSEFSGLGPTWDGRIKPDVMANGDAKNIVVATNVGKGTIENYDYDFFYGTSASTPIVTGILALMYQKFREKTGLPLEIFSMRNSTTKAMLIHSAVDLDGIHDESHNIDVYRTMVEFYKQPLPHVNKNGYQTVYVSYGKGPDFITGWGKVNASGALDIIENYDAASQKFDRFREFEIYNGMTKKWTFNIPAGAGVQKARVSLVWDDAVPSIEDVRVGNFLNSKLVNDLDMYIVSPSGKRYYPWKLDPLPSDALEYCMVTNGKGNFDEASKGLITNGLLTRTTGLEKITLEEANKAAYQDCRNPKDFRTCFDHYNNVEVVDIEGDTEGELIETGEWQVVVEGYKVKVGNSTDGFAQVASIVSDFKLEEPSCFNEEHPYLRNKGSSCVHELGDYLENYVTFDSRTYVAPGDWIYLYDASNRLIGTYTASELAGKTVTVGTNTLKVVLESNDDNLQGWGYAIENVEHLPYEVLFPIINNPWRKKR